MDSREVILPRAFRERWKYVHVTALVVGGGGGGRSCLAQVAALLFLSIFNGGGPLATAAHFPSRIFG